jgi:hypothetical protein
MNVVSNGMITAEQFKDLLMNLQGEDNNAAIKFRQLGDVWSPDFFKVVTVDGKVVTFGGEKNTTSVQRCDLSSVVQFEIRSTLEDFEPHKIYEVAP